MCADLGGRHFTRHGVPEWNQSTGRTKAKTEHGNYNAWLDAHGDDCDFWVSVDSDHVPLPLAPLAEQPTATWFANPEKPYPVVQQVAAAGQLPVLVAQPPAGPGLRLLPRRRGNGRRRVKQPGDSDGTCRGGPTAGQWWPEAARELVAD
ncbi:hypothetical protein O2V63_05715 [Modestobacter sp. VKM Ac-2977]|uniref:hypothetical protein n=1 Tax=Modestobacter sp. VKM Ac-2977 TaxID=3004131 RepID=UPI0022AA2D11|nr:hypothetical protein [Modestobacter sp. VKM Ac-2977]MCZ2819818.1 hypothetical protein [Modestobacter sp. VKM Ac-2977]